ncbi:MAG: DUF4389 domain-containing protein [Mariprofundus sp.]
MNDDLKTHVTDMNVWMRLLFMLLFGVIYTVTRIVLVIVVVLQFLWVLFTGDKNHPLLDFGNQLSAFVYQMYRYFTFNTECRPFPFSDWPDNATLPGSAQTTATDTTTVMGASEQNDIEDSVEAASESGIEADTTTAETDSRP